VVWNAFNILARLVVFHNVNEMCIVTFGRATINFRQNGPCVCLADDETLLAVNGALKYILVLSLFGNFYLECLERTDRGCITNNTKTSSI
jgi:hypothetical protein